MDTKTNYLGLDLPHPFITGAGPLCDSMEIVEKVAEAGAAAIVMRSLFEEQFSLESMAAHHATGIHEGAFWEAMDYLPEPDDFQLGPVEYLDHLARIKQATGLPVIASLNGNTPGGWLRHARAIEEAGADAIELNLYYVATDASETAEEIEARQAEIVTETRRTVKIPLAAKLSPFYTACAQFAKRLERAGADGIVVFNRFHEPDIDTEELELGPHLHLSDSRELGLRLRWLAILSGQLRCSLSVSGGVHTSQDAIKAIMAGADTVQMVSALLKNGPDHLATVRREVMEWMEEREYGSMAQMRGSMNINRCPDPASFARGNYLNVLHTWR